MLPHMDTAPDALNGPRALNPNNRYPAWRQGVAARSAFRIGFYRRGRYASRVRSPLPVLLYQQDGAALAPPAIHAAQPAPLGELARLRGGHYEPYLGRHKQAVEFQLAFLKRHLVDFASCRSTAVAA
jgi:uncharacterized protein